MDLAEKLNHAEWWQFFIVAVMIFIGCLLGNYFVKKINEARIAERFARLLLKSSNSQNPQNQHLKPDGIKLDGISPINNATRNTTCPEGISLVFNIEDNNRNNNKKRAANFASSKIGCNSSKQENIVIKDSRDDFGHIIATPKLDTVPEEEGGVLSQNPTEISLKQGVVKLKFEESNPELEGNSNKNNETDNNSSRTPKYEIPGTSRNAEVTLDQIEGKNLTTIYDAESEPAKINLDEVQTAINNDTVLNVEELLETYEKDATSTVPIKTGEIKIDGSSSSTDSSQNIETKCCPGFTQTKQERKSRPRDIKNIKDPIIFYQSSGKLLKEPSNSTFTHFLHESKRLSATVMERNKSEYSVSSIETMASEMITVRNSENESESQDTSQKPNDVSSEESDCSLNDNNTMSKCTKSNSTVKKTALHSFKTSLVPASDTAKLSLTTCKMVPQEGNNSPSNNTFENLQGFWNALLTQTPI